jgi:hypothetical protein
MALVVSPCPSAIAGRRHATVNARKAKFAARAINTPLLCPEVAKSQLLSFINQGLFFIVNHS